MDLFIKNNKIQQYYISDELKSTTNYKNITLCIDSYTYNNLSTIFMGIYSLKDIKLIKNHKGSKFIYWSGEDANITIDNNLKLINLIKSIDIIKHIAENKLVQYNLNNVGIQTEKIGRAHV